MQVVAITGSNGKTSTKDLTACVLSQRYQVTKTEGNFNNHIGLPLTILRARGTDEFGVFEIGMNHPGEIAPLAAIAAPDVAIITNIGVAHIEFMKTRDAIAQEKGMLAEALKPSGVVILSADDEYTASIAARTKADAVLVGIEKGHIQARDLRPHFHGVKFTITSQGHSVEAELPVPGVHMVRNALMAVAVGQRYGLSLADCAAGLQNLKLTKGRLEQKIVRGIHVLDDTYNANPDSVTAALVTLAQMPAVGRRIAVLGAMGELGTMLERGHRQVGDVASREGIDCLIGVGANAHWITENAYKGGVEKVVQCDSTEDAVKALREVARAGDVVLVKGSRSARMERIVEGLQAV
jgi:UDP-N-acetylmuramoyl-tripeptide--D-alanyl-D-alanine ligase